MKLHIAKEIADWYKDELELDQPAQIRFYVRYGGFGGSVPGFSLGIRVEEPSEIYAKTAVDSLTFFIETKDAWYFEDKDLYVTLNERRNEPELICK